MKKIMNVLYRVLAVVVMFVGQVVAVMAQQPTHYPDEHEPIPPTLINILIYIGGPILLFVIYYYYRKWEKKKASANARTTADRKAEAKEEGKD
ncbi:MAG: hypothetical protein JW965_01075 [Bacteroidales bacterium]|nr:hypothetical protein [Bacteroidales bacterium]